MTRTHINSVAVRFAKQRLTSLSGCVMLMRYTTRQRAPIAGASLGAHDVLLPAPALQAVLVTPSPAIGPAVSGVPELPAVQIVDAVGFAERGRRAASVASNCASR